MVEPVAYYSFLIGLLIFFFVVQDFILIQIRVTYVKNLLQHWSKFDSRVVFASFKAPYILVAVIALYGQMKRYFLTIFITPKILFNQCQPFAPPFKEKTASVIAEQQCKAVLSVPLTS